MVSYFNKSIVRQFMFSMAIILIFGLLGVGILTTTNYYVQETSNSQREVVKEKQEQIEQIQDHLLLMLFHARGYFSFKNNDELANVYKQHEQLIVAMEELEQLSLNANEVTFLNELTLFLEDYHTNLLPRAVYMVENEDYEELRHLSSSGATDNMSTILNLTRTIAKDSERHIVTINNSIFRKITVLNWIIIIYIFFILCILGIVIRRIGKNIGRPLVGLTNASEQLVKGEYIHLSHMDRKDEIGKLSRAFHEMAQSMQQKEEELMAQNEELLAQQETLEYQQQQLEQSLLELSYLNNALNKSAIVVTTDKQGKITYVNEKFTEISKYSKDEVIGRDHRLTNSGYHSKAFFKELWQTIEQGRIWTGEIKDRAKDGSYYWVDTTIVPYLDEEGKPYQYITIRTDITSRKQAEENMKYSLDELNKAKETLSKYNKLNHALSITLHKKELLDSTVTYLTEIYEFDKALITPETADLVSSIGVSKKQEEQFLENMSDSLLVRLQQSKDVHIVKRLAQVHEKGIEDKDVLCYDLYAPIYSSEGNLMSYLVATRIGRAFSEVEVDEMRGLFERISLSIEKVYLYEETEKSRLLNQDIINHVNEGITYIDTEGCLIQYNQKMVEIIGEESGRNITNCSFEVWSNMFKDRVADFKGLYAFFKNSIFTGTSKTYTYQYKIQSPIRKIYDVYATKIIRNNIELGTLIVHRDITNEYEVDKMKSELVSTVSHELRTPLSSVLGFTELMLTRELKPERQKKYIETIHKEALRLTTLINDFLDLQRMESGKQAYNKQTIDIVQIAREVVANFKVTNSSHQYVVTSPQSAIFILGDEEKIVQVFTNLVSNAVKFSPDGGEVTISFNLEEGKVVACVSDQGLGIPTEELSKLFKKFYRIDNSDRRKIGGTGLGLAITKKIIEAHYGEITVESTLGEGSVFRLILPSLQSPYNSDTNDSEFNNDSSIVIIEDDNSLGLLLLEELKEHGFHVRHFTDGRKALSNIITNRPVMIIVDLMLLDEYDGWWVINQVKANSKTERIPIIISSALEENEKSKLYNIDHYLTKPYPPSELSTVVLDILQKGNQTGEVMYPNIEHK